MRQSQWGSLSGADAVTKPQWGSYSQEATVRHPQWAAQWSWFSEEATVMEPQSHSEVASIRQWLSTSQSEAARARQSQWSSPSNTASVRHLEWGIHSEAASLSCSVTFHTPVSAPIIVDFQRHPSPSNQPYFQCNLKIIQALANFFTFFKKDVFLSKRE